MGLAVAGVVLIGLAVRGVCGTLLDPRRDQFAVRRVVLGPSAFRTLLSLSFNPATLLAIGDWSFSP